MCNTGWNTNVMTMITLSLQIQATPFCCIVPQSVHKYHHFLLFKEEQYGMK